MTDQAILWFSNPDERQWHIDFVETWFDVQSVELIDNPSRGTRYGVEITHNGKKAEYAGIMVGDEIARVNKEADREGTNNGSM